MPKRILVVDDEAFLRRLVEVNIRRAGHEVATACDGVEVLEEVQRCRPDLIVMDVMMPRLDGFEALRRLKADPQTAEIPVIMLTAKAQDEDIFYGLKAGVDCYLTKPFNPMELMAFVRRILAAYDLPDPDDRVYRL